MSYSVAVSNGKYDVTIRLEEAQTGVFTKDYFWRVVGKTSNLSATPFHEGQGTWSGSFGDMIRLWALDGKTLLLEIRQASGPKGPAYDPQEPASFQTSTFWRRVATPGQKGLWAGIAGKGGGEVGVGIEGVVAVVVSAESPSRWFAFTMGSLRGGFAAGGAAGLSLVVWTGIRAPRQIHGSIQSGSDWAVSIGAKWGAIAKDITKAKELAELGKKVNFCLDHADQFITAGKGVYQEAALDYDDVNLLIVDTPAGVGLELGYYWWVGAVAVVAEGVGVPAAIVTSNRAISQSGYRPRRI